MTGSVDLDLYRSLLQKSIEKEANLSNPTDNPFYHHAKQIAFMGAGTYKEFTKYDNEGTEGEFLKTNNLISAIQVVTNVISTNQYQYYTGLTWHIILKILVRGAKKTVLELSLPEHIVTENEARLLSFILINQDQIRDSLVYYDNYSKISFSNIDRDFFQTNSYIWSDISSKLKVVTSESLDQKNNHDLKEYTLKLFFSKVGIAQHTQKDLTKLKRSIYWKTEVLPIVKGERITQIRCKPSFITKYQDFLLK